ncbi:MAG TPA: hypothetical protein VFP93_02815 [Gammaproteobacteria bacterium]|nr:hypothetical protein [Gammaproteobacteria bacterium]
MKNRHAFSQKQILNLLRLGKKFIDFEATELFRGWPTDPGTELIDNIVLPIADMNISGSASTKLVEEALTVARTKESIEPFIKKLAVHQEKFSPEKWEALIGTLHNPKLKDVTIPSSDWTDVIKRAIMHGKILDQDSIDVRAVQALLEEELISIFAPAFNGLYRDHPQDEVTRKPNFFMELVNGPFEDPAQLGQPIERFLVRLAKLDKKKSAAIIHDFIYFAKKATEKSEATTDGMANMLNVALMSGLELSNSFTLPESYADKDDVHAMNRIAYRFMAAVALSCLQHVTDKMDPSSSSSTLEPSLLFTKSFHEQETYYQNKAVDLEAVKGKKQEFIQMLWNHPPQAKNSELTSKSNGQEVVASSSKQVDKKQKGKDRRIERPHSMPINAKNLGSRSEPAITHVGESKQNTLLQNYNASTSNDKVVERKSMKKEKKKKNILKRVFKK